MLEVIIIWLYSDGCIEVNPIFRERIGNVMTIDELVNKGWRFMSVSTTWFKALSRDDYWFGAVMYKESAPRCHRKGRVLSIACVIFMTLSIIEGLLLILSLGSR